MKTMSLYQRLADLGKSARDKQREINVSEVWHLWDHLVDRYKVINLTQVFINFARDNDLRLILEYGANVLSRQANQLERLLKEYGVPMPVRPPFQSRSTIDFEVMTDRYIFRHVFRGIQGFIPMHAGAFIQSTSPKIREEFKRFLNEEMDLNDKFVEYGKLKGFTIEPPLYRI